MKKILIVLSMLAVSSPAMAVCPITGGACTTDSDLYQPTLQEKKVPDNLEIMQSPNAFQKGIERPYDQHKLNMETEPQAEPGAATGVNGYDASCQFGVCIPGFRN